jgi:hypothetical protein
MRLVMAVVGLAFTVFVIIDFLLDSEAFLAQVPPIIEITETVALAFCMFVLPPLALFPKTIGLSARGFLLASFIFGLGVWFYGLLAAYEVWERGAAALKGYGDIAVLLLFGLSLAYLSRSAGRYLSKKADILSSVSL